MDKDKSTLEHDGDDGSGIVERETMPERLVETSVAGSREVRAGGLRVSAESFAVGEGVGGAVRDAVAAARLDSVARYLGALKRFKPGDSSGAIELYHLASLLGRRGQQVADDTATLVEIVKQDRQGADWEALQAEARRVHKAQVAVEVKLGEQRQAALAQFESRMAESDGIRRKARAAAEAATRAKESAASLRRALARELGVDALPASAG